MTICSQGHLAYRELHKKPALLRSVSLGNLILKNRVAMAPLTRRRATEDHVPTDIMATHYQQRASAGLIIAEAANISAQGTGYMNTPGIYTPQQIEAWKPVTSAVHKNGGKIFLQIWHVGRVSHPLLQDDGKLPVSASAIKAEGKQKTPEGQKEMVVPRALETDEIPEVVQNFKNAAINAIEAGFDGVEIHAANGYLIDQFLHDGSNIRTDEYGGSIENRSRFLFEVVEKVSKAIGPEKTGIRLSPSGIFKDMFDSNPVELYGYVISKLNDYNLAYLHILEPMVALEPAHKYEKYLKEVTPHFRKLYNGVLITNCGFDFQTGNRIIENGHADMVAFGKLFISNPDLVERFEKGADLNPWDANAFYTNGPEGYIDYPFMED
ncbi:MAG: alkene reductase [Bacteroidetes bacterium]|nr:MAG: alkene reductase [Bacteroidota bacterium]